MYCHRIVIGSYTYRFEPSHATAQSKELQSFEASELKARKPHRVTASKCLSVGILGDEVCCGSMTSIVLWNKLSIKVAIPRRTSLHFRAQWPPRSRGLARFSDFTPKVRRSTIDPPSGSSSFRSPECFFPLLSLLVPFASFTYERSLARCLSRTAKSLIDRGQRRNGASGERRPLISSDESSTNRTDVDPVPSFPDIVKPPCSAA